MVEYEKYIASNELELALLELEAIARDHGVTSGILRCIQTVARQINLHDKVA